MWLQQQIQLPAKSRGFHLVTREITSQLPQLKQINIGLAHIFLQHTSASLTINENADTDVRRDLENYFSRLTPENEPYFQHTQEGPDDMPAHIKSVILGVSLTVPISAGQLALGVWQGIYLCEHRNRAGKRSILVTINGV
jgi:secondary thiamine-phosphate synthase enzyme